MLTWIKPLRLKVMALSQSTQCYSVSTQRSTFKAFLLGVEKQTVHCAPLSSLGEERPEASNHNWNHSLVCSLGIFIQAANCKLTNNLAQQQTWVHVATLVTLQAINLSCSRTTSDQSICICVWKRERCVLIWKLRSCVILKTGGGVLHLGRQGTETFWNNAIGAVLSACTTRGENNVLMNHKCYWLCHLWFSCFFFSLYCYAPTVFTMPRLQY